MLYICRVMKVDFCFKRDFYIKNTRYFNYASFFPEFELVMGVLQ